MFAIIPATPSLTACIAAFAILTLVGLLTHQVMRRGHPPWEVGGFGKPRGGLTDQVVQHIRRRREIAHIERMKSIEMGRPLPTGDAWPALTCIAIGLGVPASIAFFAFLAGVMEPPQHSMGMSLGESIAFWGAPMGILAIIASTILCACWLRIRGRPQEADSRPALKPTHDPDTFDVVGRRG